jgi:hypothetical protein
MKYKPKTSQHTTPAYVENGRVAILRTGHGREGATFTTQVSYIVTPDGARLLAGRRVIKRTPANVLQFPQRPPTTSPTGEKARAAA